MDMDVCKVYEIIGDHDRFCSPFIEPYGYCIFADRKMSDENIDTEAIALYWEKLVYASVHADELIQQAFHPSFYDFYGVESEKISSADEMPHLLIFDSFVLISNEREVGANLSNPNFMFGHFIECRWDYEWNLIYSGIC